MSEQSPYQTRSGASVYTEGRPRPQYAGTWVPVNQAAVVRGQAEAEQESDDKKAKPVQRWVVAHEPCSDSGVGWHEMCPW
jgi:hypothetical protein